VADKVLRAQYFQTQVPDKPGEAAKILAHVKRAGINLLAFTGFPRAGTSLLDFVVADGDALKNAAAKAGFSLAGPKTCFLIQGDDRVGAGADMAAKLGEAKINITTIDAIRVGNRFGAILFVKPEDVDRTAQVLGAAESAQAWAA
jgi:hypothetical protein